MSATAGARRVFITGADGFLGRSLLAELVRESRFECIVAADVRPVPESGRRPGVVYLEQDVRERALGEQFAKYRIDTVVHLASIVTPGRDSNRAFEYSVDVLGSRNVLQACVAQGVQHIVVSSSGAAYGYHRDNPPWLRESDALRGNVAFAYADHKRQVEEMLADYRVAAPDLRQTVLRIGTILGESVDNQITALFEKPRLLAIRGSESPFVFIWDSDVTGAIVHALRTRTAGCYNLAGDGALPLREIARRLGKPLLVLPAWVLKGALALGHALHISRYGPEQLDFLRYRPVLLNTALKTGFGYLPSKTSSEAFDAFVAARAAQGRPLTRRS
ncbi:epimerase [Hylemonella gracilis str. Niagara R]|uniref:Epimerase n=1 Tax=Hylemonella gracilis str. Niagara R TaxID=1458275 RepID=A0A016XL90_9BURK|nr:SDR family oxidoreductase [Hylemonella gracilis]EYC52352.1 epimerase [Hylemonella gracilis str. Niagara R]